MKKNSLRAALDYSWNEASFAVVDEQNRVLASEKIILVGHDSSRLPSELRKTASACGVDLASVTEWSLGVGPGGFTGMRVASALVAGFAYGHPEIRMRGVPSAVALARTVRSHEKNQDFPKMLALFDGRHSELLAYGMKFENGNGVFDGFTAVFQKSEELRAAAQNYTLISLEKDRDPVEAFDPEMAKQVHFSPSIDAEELIWNLPDDFSASPTDLIYLRAAVFVPPKTPRVIV